MKIEWLLVNDVLAIGTATHASFRDILGGNDSARNNARKK